MKRSLVCIALFTAAAHAAFAESITGLINNDLVFFDSAAPGVILRQVGITGLQAGEDIIGVDFRPRTGGLYGVGVVNAGAADNVRLYLLNPNTGAATAVTAAPFSVTAGALYGTDFNPTVDRIRVVNSAGENFRINPNNGARADTPTNDTDLNPAGQFIDGAAYDRNFNSGLAVANRTTLYGIARSGNRLVTIGGINQSPSPNGGAINTVGAGLGFTISPAAGVGFDISPATNTAFGAWIDDATDQSGLYNVNLTTGAATLIGALGSGGTVALDGLSVAPPLRLLFGANSGSNIARVFDVRTGQFGPRIAAFPAPVRHGIRVASGDINLDGVPDLVFAAGPGSQPQVRIFDGTSNTLIAEFLAYDTTFRGGVFVAVGDVNGDGFGDIVTASGRGIVTEIRSFSGVDRSQLAAFQPFGPTFKGGATVAASDFNLDGIAEIVVGSGPGRAPEVAVFNSTGLISTFFSPFPAGRSGDGLVVAASHSELRPLPAPAVAAITPTIAVGLGRNLAQVKVFTSTSPTILPLAFDPHPQKVILAFPGFQPGGVRVALGDVNGDGVADLIAVPGPGSLSTRCRVFDTTTGRQIRTLVPFLGNGAFVAVGK
jgi:hypothetical protein